MTENQPGEQFKKFAHELRDGHGCTVADVLRQVPFEEQLKLLKMAEAVVNSEMNAPVLSVEASTIDAFNQAVISAGRTDTKLLGLFFPPKGYTATLNMDDGTVSQNCKGD